MIEYSTFYIRDNILNKIAQAVGYIIAQCAFIEFICGVLLLKTLSSEWGETSPLIILAIIAFAVIVAIFTLLATYTLNKIIIKLEKDIEDLNK